MLIHMFYRMVSLLYRKYALITMLPLLKAINMGIDSMSDNCTHR